MPAPLKPMLLLMASVAYGLHGCGARTPAGGGAVERPAALWTCSMHPQIRKSDKGMCPVCGMELVTSGPAPAASAEKAPRRVAISEKARTQAGLRTSVIGRDTYGAPSAVLFGRMLDSKEKPLAELVAYETDLPGLRIGGSVLLNARVGGQQTFLGTVTFIEPTLDAVTRTKRVRAEVVDRNRRLPAGAFVKATVSSALTATGGRPPVVVPASAVLFTGRRSLVYVAEVDMGVPAYEARVVELGPRTRDVYPVLTGLSEGERVVTNGVFALDAEVQLRGGLSMMSMGDDPPLGELRPTPDRLAPAARDRDRDRDFVVRTPPELERKLGPAFDAYLRAHRALAAGDADAARRAAVEVGKVSASVRPLAGDPIFEAWISIAKPLEAYAAEVVAARDVEAARAAFADLSQAMLRLLRTFGNQAAESLRVVHCPMARAGAGADWIQVSPEVENPYFGQRMYRCGEIRQVVAATSHLSAAP